MSEDDKIVSLAQRRRAAEAEQKARMAAEAKARKEESRTRRVPARPLAAGGFGRLIGRILAALVWIAGLGSLALLLWDRFGPAL